MLVHFTRVDIDSSVFVDTQHVLYAEAVMHFSQRRTEIVLTGEARLLVKESIESVVHKINAATKPHVHHTKPAPAEPVHYPGTFQRM